MKIWLLFVAVVRSIRHFVSARFRQCAPKFIVIIHSMLSSSISSYVDFFVSATTQQVQFKWVLERCVEYLSNSRENWRGESVDDIATGIKRRRMRKL